MSSFSEHSINNTKEYKVIHFIICNLSFEILASPTQTTLATKKRQAITGVRQNAFTAHSSITTTLMD
jgi:hypothetical protein